MLLNNSFKLIKLLNKRRLISTCTLIKGNSNKKSLALPIAFLSVKGWSEKSVEETYSDWAEKFSNEGYSSLLIEVDPNELTPKPKDSKSLLDQLETKLKTLLTKSDSPYPPLLIASSLSTLLSQTYVSSHPLTGLLLINPPNSNTQARVLAPQILTTELDEFDFEPHYNVAIMEKDSLKFKGNRLLEDYGLEEDKGKVVGLIGEINEQGWDSIVDWMDESGM